MSHPTTNGLCPLCGGAKKPATTTFSADLETGVVVVRRVPARICSQCGEEWISDRMARKLEQIVARARKNHSQGEVLVI
jgi:YgiT-type zinc finger domain-containing protein